MKLTLGGKTGLYSYCIDCGLKNFATIDEPLFIKSMDCI